MPRATERLPESGSDECQCVARPIENRHDGQAVLGGGEKRLEVRAAGRSPAKRLGAARLPVAIETIGRTEAEDYRLDPSSSLSCDAASKRLRNDCTAGGKDNAIAGVTGFAPETAG